MGESKEKTREKSFFKGVKQEFKKIIWPDRTTLARQTTAVVSVSVFLGLIITVVDILVKYGIDLVVK